ncbi:hypothetical protein ACFYO1_43060 [Nocardia sp. NPDC006044]|uniref:hypothetical protein n=1 Tax=Nocardia sp. NPDC006044 TaxID=3364306 RepID=UPI0036CFD9CE
MGEHRHHREKEAVALRDRNRKEAVDALVEALESTMAYWRLLGALHDHLIGTLSADNLPTTQEVDDATMAMISTQLKLELLGLDSEQSVDSARKQLDVIAGAVEAAQHCNWGERTTHGERCLLISVKPSLVSTE